VKLGQGSRIEESRRWNWNSTSGQRFCRTRVLAMVKYKRCLKVAGSEKARLRPAALSQSLAISGALDGSLSKSLRLCHRTCLERVRRAGSETVHRHLAAANYRDSPDNSSLEWQFLGVSL
jgi:hypothetical protein